MAEPTTTEVLQQVNKTLDAMQDAQATVVEFTGKLAEHNTDEDAHCGALKKLAQLGTMGDGLKLDSEGHPAVDIGAGLKVGDDDKLGVDAHAATTSKYGLGDASNFGHVKLVDSATTAHTAASGIAASGKALADAVATIPVAGTANPKALGTAAVGISARYAREDHVHPKQDVSDKADISLSNLNASGKTVCAHMGMPSSRYIQYPVTPTTGLIAPADGYVYMFTQVSIAAAGVYLYNETKDMYSLVESAAAGHTLAVYLPVSKGDSFSFYGVSVGAGAGVRFYYAEGAK